VFFDRNSPLDGKLIMKRPDGETEEVAIGKVKCKLTQVEYNKVVQGLKMKLPKEVRFFAGDSVELPPKKAKPGLVLPWISFGKLSFFFLFFLLLISFIL
jgi:hypothetical protein